ncbi:MAG: extracellular solute-binding protein [Eubacteriales bacterium]|nr:extracellular solute-binding protein [Eubacteriales bacterium]
MKKKVLLGMGVAAAFCFSAATVSAEPVEVDLWHYFDASADAQAIVDWVDEYNTLQDDIHIKATYVSRDELMNQYTVGAISGELPDIGMVDSPDMASYISLGVFEDITEELNAWGELENFYEGPLSSCMDADGNLYGLPQNSNCLALACNLDALEAAGYDHMPTSLAELQEMAAAVTDPDTQTYGFAMCCISTEEGTFQILPWLRGTQNGEEVENVNELTAEPAVAGLTALADMINNGYMSKECINWTQADAFNQFAAGKAAMAEVGTWHLAQTDVIDGFNYGFCLLPTGDEGTSSSTIGGENFGVCTGAENKEACVEFLKWMCSKENAGKWGVVAGKIPTRSDSTAEYDYEQDGFAVFTEEMNYADARGPHPEWPSISEAIYSATQSVFVDGTDPAEALAGAMDTITPIVEETPLP